MKCCFTTALLLLYYCFTTEAIHEEQVLIIVGETGSGKTTQIMQVPVFFSPLDFLVQKVPLLTTVIAVPARGRVLR